MSQYYLGYLNVAMFAIVGTLVFLIIMGFSMLIRKAMPTPSKLSTYECGEIPIGDPWIKFHISYYIFALIFVIFDIETVFLYPWAVQFRTLGLFGFIEMMIFLAVLLIGLIYAWKKGVLKWA